MQAFQSVKVLTTTTLKANSGAVGHGFNKKLTNKCEEDPRSC